MRSSAGCCYSAGISLYSAHTGTIQRPLPYRVGVLWVSPVIEFRPGVCVDEWIVAGWVGGWVGLALTWTAAPFVRSFLMFLCDFLQGRSAA